MFIALLAFLTVQMSEADVPPVCVTTPTACRAMAPFNLFVGDGEVTIGDESVQPWIVDGVLFLTPGEGVVLQMSPEGPTVRAPVIAKSVLTDEWIAQALGTIDPSSSTLQPQQGEALKLTGPAGGVRISFRQGTGVRDMFLVVENGDAAPISYTAHMMVIGPEGLQWAPTSVCTALPEAPSAEHWPHPIIAVRLSDFRIEEKGAGIVCR